VSHAVRPSAAHAPVSDQVSASETSALDERAYQGLVTRTIAFAIDGAIINVVAIVVGTGIALVLSVLHLPQELDPILVALGGASFLLWSIGYFVVLWSSTGETAGDRVMRIRVIMADGGGPPRPLRALVRLGALILAAIPLFLGLFPILVDERRRGVHDMLVGTVVVAAPDATPAPTRGHFSGRRSP
jgi:uncharacterized RDD family membrane protein YckC